MVGAIALAVLSGRVGVDKMLRSITIGTGIHVTGQATSSTGCTDVYVQSGLIGTDTDVVFRLETGSGVAGVAGGGISAGKTTDHTFLALIG